MNRVLMIAYHFPPVHVSSGVHRTLYFVKHLPEHKWHPLVLTVHPRAYVRTENGLVTQIPPDVPVVRAFALDARRHLSIKGRYLGLMGVPDPWQSWWPFGVVAGLSLIRRYRPRVLWSTFPVATAVLIAWSLHKLTGLPWVADLRDPMVSHVDSVPTGVRAARRILEQKTVKSASSVVLTTPRTARTYRSRYPDVSSYKWHTIENGFDEEAFAACERRAKAKYDAGPMTLVHSGLLYRSGRDPSSFLDALHKLALENRIASNLLRITFRASGDEEFYQAEIHRRNLESMVSLAPPLPYDEALEEMLSASGLLLFQGSLFNDQVPAKAYEYLRTRRPILALIDPQGETAELLKRAKCNALLVPINDAAAIAAALPKFLDLIFQPTDIQDVHNWSRAAGCEHLGIILDEVSGGSSK